MKTERHGWIAGLQLLFATLVLCPGAFFAILIPISPIPYLALLALVPLPFHIYLAARGHRFPMQILSGLIATAPYLLLIRAALMSDGTPAKVPL